MWSQNNVRDLKETAHIFPHVCMCGYVYMYIYICVICTCICVCVYMCMMGVYMHVCDMSVCLYIYMCVYVYYCVLMSVCACVCNVYVLYACVWGAGGNRVRRIKISCRLLLSHSPQILTYLSLYTSLGWE